MTPAKDEPGTRRVPSQRTSERETVGTAAESTSEAGQRSARRVRRFLHALPFASSAVSIVIGVLVLVGWSLGRLHWTTVLPDLPPTTPNAALMAVLAGISLVLCAPETVSTLRSTLSRLFAAAVTLIAGLTLVEHVFGIDLAIDRALFSVGKTIDGYPVRPSPQTATAFALTGVSLLAINARTKGGRYPAQFLALIAALIPLVALFAYVFGTAELYGARALYPYIGMGLATAVALLALSTGTLAVRADEGILSVLMASDSGGLAARGLVAWLVALTAATCGIEAGARFGLYAAPIGAAGTMLIGIVGGSIFVLRLSVKLSHLDAKAQQAIQTREDLMGVVAHDLRNPLSTILMAASFLKDLSSEKGEPSNESTGVIERSARRMNRLIEDLLDVTRIEAGGLSIRKSPLDARRLLADSVSAEQPLAATGRLDLQLDTSDGLPAVSGDHDRLLQVLENLIGNAIKFTEPGGRITVGAKRKNNDVLFWVADTGHGVPPEDVPRLFNRFWQGGGAKRHGAGLGLPIVKGIVEAHGGTVWVESTPKVGTTFFFTIPAAD